MTTEIVRLQRMKKNRAFRRRVIPAGFISGVACLGIGTCLFQVSPTVKNTLVHHNILPAISFGSRETITHESRILAELAVTAGLLNIGLASVNMALGKIADGFIRQQEAIEAFSGDPVKPPLPDAAPQVRLNGQK